MGSLHQTFKQAEQVAAMLLHGCGVKERGRVVQRSADGALFFSQGEFKIEPHPVWRSTDYTDFQVREIKGRVIVILPAEHHLEYRTVIKPARRLYDFNDLFEWQI